MKLEEMLQPRALRTEPEIQDTTGFQPSDHPHEETQEKKGPSSSLPAAALNGTEVAHCFHRYGEFSGVSDEDAAAALEEIRLRADRLLEALP